MSERMNSKRVECRLKLTIKALKGQLSAKNRTITCLRKRNTQLASKKNQNETVHSVLKKQIFSPKTQLSNQGNTTTQEVGTKGHSRWSCAAVLFKTSLPVFAEKKTFPATWIDNSALLG